jgi:hypothetical protein
MSNRLRPDLSVIAAVPEENDYASEEQKRSERTDTGNLTTSTAHFLQSGERLSSRKSSSIQESYVQYQQYAGVGLLRKMTDTAVETNPKRDSSKMLNANLPARANSLGEELKTSEPNKQTTTTEDYELII